MGNVGNMGNRESAFWQGDSDLVDEGTYQLRAELCLDNCGAPLPALASRSSEQTAEHQLRIVNGEHPDNGVRKRESHKTESEREVGPTVEDALRAIAAKLDRVAASYIASIRAHRPGDDHGHGRGSR